LGKGAYAAANAEGARTRDLLRDSFTSTERVTFLLINGRDMETY